MSPQAVSAIATSAAVVAALVIALSQNRAQLRAMAGVQREKAACIAITEWDANSVTIKNFGSTPFLRVRVDKAEANLQEGPGPAWEMAVVGTASPGVSPGTAEVVGPHETVTFDFTNWVNDSDRALLSAEQVRSLQRPHVTWRYTDAVGTRWERKGNNRPEPTGGGTPLPGSIPSRERWADLWRRYRPLRKPVEPRRDQRLAPRRREGRSS